MHQVIYFLTEAASVPVVHIFTFLKCNLLSNRLTKDFGMVSFIFVILFVGFFLLCHAENTKFPKQLCIFKSYLITVRTIHTACRLPGCFKI